MKMCGTNNETTGIFQQSTREKIIVVSCATLAAALMVM